MILKRLAEIIWFGIFLFLFFSILPAIFMVTGNEKMARGIHSLYRISCHQRVERSIFLFGVEGPVNTYSVEELQFLGVIPEVNPNVPHVHSETIYGYPYIGDEIVGYKTALCVRDLAIYTGILITGAVYLLWVARNKKITKFDWRLILILVLPMIIDGTFQLIAEIFRWDWVPDIYFANNAKRVVTGLLFGMGFALMIFPNLKESSQLWYNDREKDDAKGSIDKKEK